MHVSPSFGYTDSSRELAYAALRHLRRFEAAPNLWVCWRERHGWCLAHTGSDKDQMLLHFLLEFWTFNFAMRRTAKRLGGHVETPEEAAAYISGLVPQFSPAFILESLQNGAIAIKAVPVDTLNEAGRLRQAAYTDLPGLEGASAPQWLRREGAGALMETIDSKPIRAVLLVRVDTHTPIGWTATITLQPVQVIRIWDDDNQMHAEILAATDEGPRSSCVLFADLRHPAIFPRHLLESLEATWSALEASLAAAAEAGGQ